MACKSIINYVDSIRLKPVAYVQLHNLLHAPLEYKRSYYPTISEKARLRIYFGERL